MAKALILIDGHNLLYRSFSIPYKFYTKKNIPLHVTNVFLGLLRRSLDHPSDIACAVVFDTNTKSDNHIFYPEYKANRPEFAEDEETPFHHLPFIERVLDELGITTIEKEHIEADDIIASLAVKHIVNNDTDVVCIVSTDTDYYQLLNEKVSILKLLSGGGKELITPHEVFEKIHVYPHEYAYYKSLVGDSADNIKGVPGIGKVRAAKIIRKELQMDLELFQDIIKRNLQLITLNTSVPIPLSYSNFSVDKVKLMMSNQEIFAACNFF